MHSMPSHFRHGIAHSRSRQSGSLDIVGRVSEAGVVEEILVDQVEGGASGVEVDEVAEVVGRVVS